MNHHLRLSGAATALLLTALAEPSGAQARQQATTAPVATSTRPGATNWLSDAQELTVGDVITLYVNDAVIASATRSQTGRDATSREGSFSMAPPAPGSPVSAGFGTGERASSEQRGDMSRNVAFRTTISVRVTARNPDGTYTVQGTRSLSIDKNSQDISITGVLRAEDVTVHNEADGDRLANAKIVVKQKGRLGRTRGGFIGRILGAVWP